MYTLSIAIFYIFTKFKISVHKSLNQTDCRNNFFVFFSDQLIDIVYTFFLWKIPTSILIFATGGRNLVYSCFSLQIVLTGYIYLQIVQTGYIWLMISLSGESKVVNLPWNPKVTCPDKKKHVFNQALFIPCFNCDLYGISGGKTIFLFKVFTLALLKG